MKLIVSLGLFLLLGLSAFSASAGCTAVNGWTDKKVDISLPASVVVQNDAPIGSLLAQQSYVMPSETIMDCTPGNYPLNGGFLNGSQADSTGLVATNVTGVGMRITFGGRPINTWATTIPAAAGANLAKFANNEAFVMQLIKTGPITGGKVTAGVYAGIALKNVYWIADANLTQDVNIVNVACSVTNKAISVPMGTVYPSDFKGVGTSTSSVSFSVPLSCNSGAKVNIQLDGVSDASGAIGVISLDSSGSVTVASGVGLQLLLGKTPIALATPTAVGTATSEGAFSVLLAARYYQTGSQVKVGQANATATFTMTYN